MTDEIDKLKREVQSLEKKISDHITLKTGEGLSGKVYQTGEPLYIKNKDRENK